MIPINNSTAPSGQSSQSLVRWSNDSHPDSMVRFEVDAAKIVCEPVSQLGKWKSVRADHDPVSDKSGKPVAYRLELMLADTGSHWFYTEVFGPSPTQDFEAWAINDRALDLFVRQFRHA